MTLLLKVTGMHCGNCQAKVERALKAVPGTWSARVDVQAGEAEVDFDGQTPADVFVQAIRSVCYDAQLAA